MCIILKTGDLIKAGDFIKLGLTFTEKDLEGCCDRVKGDYPIIMRTL